MGAAMRPGQIRLTRRSPTYWRVTFDNPPLNLVGPEFLLEFREILIALEADKRVKVIVFDSAVEGFFLNDQDHLVRLEGWPDILMRLTRAPVVTIALIRGRATGSGGEFAVACDMSFASRETAVLSQWGVSPGTVAVDGSEALRPQQMRTRCVQDGLLGSDGIGAEFAQACGFVNRAMPDAELDKFVDVLATRVASLDKGAIANAKRLMAPLSMVAAAAWEEARGCIGRPHGVDRSTSYADRLKAYFQRWFHRPNDSEDSLGSYSARLEH